MEDGPLPNICRACMSEGDTFQSIFVPDENTGSIIHLAEMIMSYASVQITLGDGLPEQICSDCAKSVSEFYLFKKRCEESDKYLRMKFGKSPLILEADESCPTNLNEDSKDLIKAETFEEHKKIEGLKPSSSDDDEPEYVLTHQMENAADSTVEPEELIGNDSVDPFFELKSPPRLDEDEEGGTSNPNADPTAIVKAESFEERKKIDVLKNTSSDDDEPEYVIKNTEPEELIGNDSIDPFLHLKSEYEGGDKFYDGEDFDLLKPADHKRKYTCELCEKKFIKNSHLTRHMKTHAKVKAHMCVQCNKGFARAEQLAHHVNMHSGIKPHVCKICTKGFNQLSNLKDHMRTHNGEKPFLCSTCGKGFNQLGNLRQHTVRHSGIKAHLCSICGNGFASKGELGAHLRKHTGARPFVCPVCNHGFTTSSSLTKHKRIHSGEKPYECEVCKMKFSRSGILARHRRTHTGEKPYVCKYCTKAFSQSNDLSSHLRIHTGEKPFICDVCGTAFRQSSAMKTHKKTHLGKSLLTSKVVISMMHSTFLNTL